MFKRGSSEHSLPSVVPSFYVGALLVLLSPRKTPLPAVSQWCDWSLSLSALSTMHEGEGAHPPPPHTYAVAAELSVSVSLAILTCVPPAHPTELDLAVEDCKLQELQAECG